MNINSVMVGRNKELHLLIWVVERTKKRGNPLFSPSLIVIVMTSIAFCVCKSSSLEMHDAKRQFLSLGGFTRVILNCSSLDVETICYPAAA